MDLPEDSNGIDKSWDHPWTTDEMRQKRNEWSLAADAGLLQHLKQFSNNLTENVQKTKDKLNLLTSDLNETSVIIDNITNASLALANTQFIESRVHEDDIETKLPQGEEDEKIKDGGLDKEDLIVCVSESIKEGLRIMDEKFQRVEVIASDSEDEGGIPITSIVLEAKNPYQNRPLPYVIGSDKWKNSSKVGLESSSSDSEPPEGDDDSAVEDDDKILQSDMIVNNRRESLMRRSSLTSSESSDRNERIDTVKHYSGISSRTDKLAARSQDTLNSGSEMATPTVAESRPESSGKGAPSFAEELAKRLGNVLPSGNVLPDGQETDRASIHRSADDLFAPDNDDVFGTNSENPFSGGGNLFDAEVSSSLWKNKPYRAPEINVISPCLDIPPPIQSEAKKSRSAFDDLCGDADSEDSDDIFTGKSSSRNTVHQQNSVSDSQRENVDFRENKFLGNVKSDNATNMATSTPETNDNGGIFGDDSEGDDDDLFGKSIKSGKRMTERSPEIIRTTGIAKPPGLSITQADILGSDLGNRLFSRVPRQDSADSSDSDSLIPTAEAKLNEPVIPDDSNQNSASISQNKSEPSSIVAGNATHDSQVNVEDTDSSGISILPNSTGNIFGLGVDFQPPAESTRLKSEDVYRERISSDSLFAARTRPVDASNSINNSSNQPREIRVAGTLDSHPEEDFDSDDVFGPPPLPKANSKSKSEVASVDDLFSTISSGSRSQKSSDLLAAAEPQLVGKSAAGGSKSWFDEDIDIFDSRDVPDLDIFSAGFKSSVTSKDAGASKPKTEAASGQSATRKSPDLFFNVPTDTTGNIGSNTKNSSARKPNSIFDDSEEDDDDDLFGSSNFLKADRKPLGMIKSDDDNLFANTTKSSDASAMLTAPKKDFTGEVASAGGANESVTKPDAKRDSDVADTIENSMPSYPSGGLFDNLDDDDDDSLFDNKKIERPKEKSISPKVAKKSTVENEDSSESKMEASKSNNRKIEGLKNPTEKEERDKKVEKGDELFDTDNDKHSTKKSPKPLPKKKPTEISPKQLLEKVKEREKEKRRENKEEETNEKGKEKDISTTDGAKISVPRSSPEIISEITKRDPPKTLSIRLPMPSNAEDSTQAPRRAVSGKIKNLMGKMGDLKILSPTDTPPLWKKAEEKSDVDEESTENRDSEDGSSISVPSAKTPPVNPDKIEDFGIASQESKEPPPSSPLDDSGNSESAVSFDVPVQVETLTVTASKSRARIQAKRRPQSRHARQSALRKSGIDFDTVDTSSAEAGESDPSDNTMSGIADKVPTVVTDSVDSPKTVFDSDRLVAPEVDNERSSIDKPVETSSSLAPDDKSEISFSKGSSMSINKNTLLSPSTDEEDLFDVPPDLPEDPPKEDTIFGRAPILSPIDGFLGTKHTRTKEKSKENRTGLRESSISADKDARSAKNEKSTEQISKETKSREALDEIGVENVKTNEKNKDSEADKPMDPLRDSSLDPLKDPSQLFAFVTKTPSPEKGQNLLFKEDDSLFTRAAKKSGEESKTVASKKTVLDLFADDSGGDLFSAPLAKPAKKSVKKAAKSSGLFDDVDTDEDGTSDLFGSGVRAKTSKEKVENVDDMIASKSSVTSGAASPNRGSSVFADDADDDLFVDALDKKFSPEPEKIVPEIAENTLFPVTSKAAKDSKLKDLFGDQSSGEEDIFATKKTIGSGKSSGAALVFSDDDDSADIFGKKTTDKSSLKVDPTGNRTSAKKAVTRDLKKTAEKIVEDPLSMLQDD